MEIEDLRILIVDNDEFRLKSLRLILQVIGVTFIETAGSGRDAIAIIDRSESKIDVLVSDLDINDIDGMHLLRLLSDLTDKLSVIIISAQADSIMRSVGKMAQAYGMVFLGALSTPATPVELRIILKKYVRSQITQANHTNRSSNALSLNDIEEGLSNGYFVPFFQPKVDIQSMQVLGFEVLARYKHPKHGLLPPRTFIDAMEFYGLTTKLTLSIFTEAMRQIQTWGISANILTLSLNITHSALAKSDFCYQLKKLAQVENFPFNRIIVEVVETVAMTECGPCLETLNRLRLNNIGLSIDDFGTGFSSLEQLYNVPYTELKIDRCLVDGVSQLPRLQQIVHSTIAMARNLGITSVVEGVETKADLAYLKAVGCDVVQGFLIAKPMSGADASIWLDNWIGIPDYSTKAAKLNDVDPLQDKLVLPATNLSQCNVLLVDDDKFNLRVTERMLLPVGLKSVTTARNGCEALKVLSKQQVDLIITDYDMPQLNGLELLKKIRTGDSAAPRELPIILLTDKPASHVLSTSLQLDVNGFINKPTTSSNAEHAINQTFSETETILEAIRHYHAISTSEFISTVQCEKRLPANVNLDQVVDLPLSQLRPDMQLLNDTLTKHNIVLLVKHTTLNQRYIDLLKRWENSLTHKSFRVLLKNLHYKKRFDTDES